MDKVIAISLYFLCFLELIFKYCVHIFGFLWTVWKRSDFYESLILRRAIRRNFCEMLLLSKNLLEDVGFIYLFINFNFNF